MDCIYSMIRRERFKTEISHLWPWNNCSTIITSELVSRNFPGGSNTAKLMDREHCVTRQQVNPCWDWTWKSVFFQKIQSWLLCTKATHHWLRKPHSVTYTPAAIFWSWQNLSLALFVKIRPMCWSAAYFILSSTRPLKAVDFNGT